MTSTSPPSPLGLKLVQDLKDAIEVGKGAGLGTSSHRLPIGSADGRPALVYAIDLTLDDDGVYLATCRQLPEIFLTAACEDEALSLARVAILETLIRRRKHPFASL